MKILETQRAYLREYEREDGALLSKILSNSRSMAYAPMTATSDLTVAKDLIEWHRQSYTAHGFGAWAVILKENGIFAGQAGLLKHAEDVELFYSYLPEYWGRGLATEVALACRDFAFERFGLDHLIAIIHPDNRAAAAVASKVGMTLSGKLRLWDRDNLLYRVERPSRAAPTVPSAV
jgi:RimJ/RimL family protein N-acetyltransferase